MSFPDVYTDLYTLKRISRTRKNNEQLIEEKLNENYYHSGLLIGYW